MKPIASLDDLRARYFPADDPERNHAAVMERLRGVSIVWPDTNDGLIAYIRALENLATLVIGRSKSGE